jgi:methionyl-tRNA formyltransferase
LKIVFVGTPKVAAHYLNFLAQRYEICLVVTQLSKPKGRGLLTQDSEVASYAKNNNLPLIETSNINDKAVLNKIKDSQADLGVVVAFGQLINYQTRSVIPKGFVNLHFSLLPELRGADPVAAAIRNGATSTGVSVFELIDELDAGPIYTQIDTSISLTDDGNTLFEKLISLGEIALVEAISKIEQSIAPEPQPGSASFAGKSNSRDYKIDWNSDSESIVNLVRSQIGKKMAWTTFNEQILKISKMQVVESNFSGFNGEVKIDNQLVVKTGTGHVEILEVIPAGKKKMTAAQWARGLKIDKLIFE